MNNIPSIVWLSIGSVFVAVFGMLIVPRMVRPLNVDEHQGFIDAMLSIVGTLVSILLGLLVAAALDHYSAMEQTVDLEASSAAQIGRLSFGLPRGAEERIQRLCGEYCRLAVDEEWPAMANGGSSPKLLLNYMQIVGTVVSFRPSNDGETNVHAALITAMLQLGDCRRQRMLALNSPWAAHLMPVLIMCSLIVLAFAYLYVRRGAVLHGVLICMVAVALGGNLGLVFLLSNPFSGEWRIQPKGFQMSLEVLRRIQSNPELRRLLEPQLPAGSGLPMGGSPRGGLPVGGTPAGASPVNGLPAGAR